MARRLAMISIDFRPLPNLEEFMNEPRPQTKAGVSASPPAQAVAAQGEPAPPVVLLSLTTPWGTMTVSVSYLWEPVAPPPAPVT